MEFRDKERSILQHIVFGICITPIILLFGVFIAVVGFLIYEKVLMNFDFKFLLDGIITMMKIVAVMYVIGFGLLYGSN